MFASGGKRVCFYRYSSITFFIRWRYCNSIWCSSSISNTSFYWWGKLFNNKYVCITKSTIFYYWVNYWCFFSYFVKNLCVLSQKSGIVNVYSYDNVLKNGEPKPIKYLKNLTTPIQNVKINASSELLAINSYHLPRAVRLVRKNKNKYLENIWNIFFRFICQH